jgi:enoyl-CoA hydratase/carnithine racemase
LPELTSLEAPVSDTVGYKLQGAVAVLTFNRPDRLNAMSLEMENAYFDYLLAAEQDPDVRVIITTGAGRGYCSGGDVQTLQKIGSRDTGSAARPPAETRAKALQARTHDLPLRLAKPVIAAINGACAGLGLVQALMCDIRFASAEAKFTTAFSRRGLIAEHGISWMLPRLVGRATALDLLLSGRTFRGEEAERLGLVHWATSPGETLEKALGYASDLAANCSPESMKIIKAQVEQDDHTGLADALRDSHALMRASWKTPDFREGVRSFVEKRPPAFSPLASS